jgi:hypothetical protein
MNADIVLPAGQVLESGRVDVDTNFNLPDDVTATTSASMTVDANVEALPTTVGQSEFIPLRANATPSITETAGGVSEELRLLISATPSVETQRFKFTESEELVGEYNIEVDLIGEITKE